MVIVFVKYPFWKTRALVAPCRGNSRRQKVLTNHKTNKTMKNKFIRQAIVLVGAMAVSPFAGLGATWSTTAQYGQYTFSTGYACNNDEWGSGYGPQTLYVDTTSGSAPHFWASGNQPHGSGNIKSYPDARITIDETVSSLTKLVGTFNDGPPPNGQSVHDYAFDCWIPSEVMVWTHWDRQAEDGSLYQSNVTISGVTYNVYHGSYWTFARTSQTTSGSADLAAIFKWLVNGGHLANGTVGSCQYGVEIVDGNTTWTVHSCSITQ